MKKWLQHVNSSLCFCEPTADGECSPVCVQTTGATEGLKHYVFENVFGSACAMCEHSQFQNCTPAIAVPSFSVAAIAFSRSSIILCRFWRRCLPTTPVHGDEDVSEPAPGTKVALYQCVENGGTHSRFAGRQPPGGREQPGAVPDLPQCAGSALERDAVWP